MSNLSDRDLKHLWHPYTQMQTAPAPIPIVRGEGVYLYTEDGRKILDGISSWWVNIHGHSHPYLNQALAQQAAELEHVIFAGFTHRPAVELAERLVAILPAGLTRIFYSDNGSTAVEAALKMAYQYWRNRGEEQRRVFITLEHAYHGDTVGAMSASEDSAFTQPFSSLLFQVRRATSPYCFRHPEGPDPVSVTAACLADLEHLLSESEGRIAAVLIEPMLQGAGGMIMHPAEYLTGVRRLCDQYGTLLIADEVLTGFGRTGRMFACEHAQIVPDIICLSKGLTGGYLPLAVTAATEPVYEAFLSDDRRKTFFHGHSYTANPLGCAVGLASLELFERDDTLNRIRTLEVTMRERFTKLTELPHVGEVRVLGGVGVVELVQDRRTKSAGGYLDRVGPELAAEFMRRGLLLRPLGNTLYVMPPYVISVDETDWVLKQMEEVLTVWRWPQ
ncbi:MAG: adenosylmethionine--8-amino-7-oxononanoate transaminase [Pyrinomonadaceae bacterium]